ncbi:hypothetical protein M2263_004169 [Providencia alcalifaciens]|nr:hypothetical protein [Providencia alcalifaciens]
MTVKQKVLEKSEENANELLMIMQNSTKLGRKDRVKMIHQIALLHSLFLQGIIWNALYGNHHQSPTSFS